MVLNGIRHKRKCGLRLFFFVHCTLENKAFRKIKDPFFNITENSYNTGFCNCW